jgi:hypothetical protein
MHALLTPKYLLVLLILAAFSSGAWAGRIDDLYSAEVSLPGGASSGLPEAFDAALAEVLVKVTGRRGVAADEEVMKRFENASTLVQQYRIDPGGMVWILFDGAAIKRILDRAGQPVWGEERPITLVWMIMDAGQGEREILASGPGDGEIFATPAWRRKDASTEALVREILVTTAKQRAVPVMLPLVDSEDVTSISVSEVWGGFVESLVAASARYGSDAILVGRARLPSVEGARVRWTLLLDEDRVDWESDIAGGPNELADFFAARLATSIDASRRIMLRVGGVDSLNDYGRVSGYIGALDVVEGFTVDRVFEDEVIFALTVRGDVNRLRRAIGLRRVLQTVDDEFGVNDEHRPAFNVAIESLYYRLSPEI